MKRRDERGVGTVLTATVCVVLLLAAWTASVLVAWLAQVSATQNAADLVSLAAAGSYASGGQACDAAEEVAQRNSAELVECTVRGDDWSFVVEVSVSQRLTPALPGAPEHVERTATAGTIQ